MSEAVAIIERLSASPIVYGDVRCITLGLMDQIHGRKAGTAKNTFSRHRDKLAEGKHYYRVSRKELGELSTFNVPNSGEGNPNIETVLLTERGYGMLVKTFNDALAWEIQDRMVDGYFQATEKAKPVGALQQIADALRCVAETQQHTLATVASMNDRILRLESARPEYAYGMDFVDPCELVRKRWPGVSKLTLRNIIRRLETLHFNNTGLPLPQLSPEDNAKRYLERRNLWMLDRAFEHYYLAGLHEENPQLDFGLEED